MGVFGLHYVLGDDETEEDACKRWCEMLYVEGMYDNSSNSYRKNYEDRRLLSKSLEDLELKVTLNGYGI